MVKVFFFKLHLKKTSLHIWIQVFWHCFLYKCSYKTGRKEHYIRHVNNVHNNKRPYLCDHCGKAFKRPDALKQHRVTHVELDPSLGAFRCPVCGKCCRSQAQLTQHLVSIGNSVWTRYRAACFLAKNVLHFPWNPHMGVCHMLWFRIHKLPHILAIFHSLVLVKYSVSEVSSVSIIRIMKPASETCCNQIQEDVTCLTYVSV
jgi:hypothetical protein